jgi:tetratricopeptide (TPR) repeat protein
VQAQSGDSNVNAPYARLSIAALVAVWLSACASVPASAPVPSAAATPPQDSVKLPDVALDSQTLYDILLGEIAAQRGEMDVASTMLGKVAESTRDPRIAERAALTAMYARRYDQALKVARIWAEVQPDDPDAHEVIAAALLELQRFDEARTEFNRLVVIEAAQNNADEAFMRVAALLSRQTGHSAQALGIMRDLVNRYPNSATAQFAFAHLSVRLGDLNQALAASDKALALRPDWEEAALFKARILVSLKQLPQAQQCYEQFLRRYPSATVVRRNYARLLVDEKQWDNAREEFIRVVEETPDDAEATYAAGLLSLQTNRPDDAEKYLKRTLELRPQNDQARIYLGQIAEDRKDYAAATRWYSEVQPGDQYFEAQVRLSAVMAREGDLAKARAHLHAIKAENDAQRVQKVLFEDEILRDAKQYAEAFDVLSRALAKMPDDKDLLYARALEAEKLGKLDVTERDLRKVIKLDPKHAQALNALGYTLADRTTRFQEAQALLTQALALKPDDAYILDSMGWLKYRMGDNAEAVKYLRRALEIRSDAEIAAHLGEVLWVMGDHSGAESVWNRALHDTPGNEALLSVMSRFKDKKKE